MFIALRYVIFHIFLLSYCLHMIAFANLLSVLRLQILSCLYEPRFILLVYNMVDVYIQGKCTRIIDVYIHGRCTLVMNVYCIYMANVRGSWMCIYVIDVCRSWMCIFMVNVRGSYMCIFTVDVRGSWMWLAASLFLGVIIIIISIIIIIIVILNIASRANLSSFVSIIPCNKWYFVLDCHLD